MKAKLIKFAACTAALLVSSSSFALEIAEKELAFNNSSVPLVGIKNLTEDYQVIWLSSGVEIQLPPLQGKLIPCSKADQLTILFSNESNELVESLKCGYSYSLIGSVQ